VSLRIQNNVEALGAHRNLNATAGKVAKSMERLSSGYRINRAADDAAGLGISERMRGQIKGLGQAQRNIQDGVSLVQTAEGNLDEVHAMLQRIRELAVQYKNGSLSSENQTAITSEVTALKDEIERIGTTADFNGTKLLTGEAGTGGTVSFQVGANDGDVITVATASLGSTLGSDFATLSLAGSDAIADIDTAISGVSALRGQFGAVQNRLEHAMQATAVYHENLVASESRIRDVDMAAEMVNLSKQQILQQAGTSMLAQANQAPQQVLSLIR
jgi:flagellin